jgi:hypothetical protein
MIEEG